MQGIEANILQSPYSLFISLILFFGLISVGNLLQKTLSKKLKIFSNYEYSIFFSPIFGSYLLILIIYPFLIFEIYASQLIEYLCYLLFFLGILNIYSEKKFYFSFIKKLNFKYDLLFLSIIFIYVLLFFISASPITHADSLDYHFSGALDIFKKGSLHKEILPMDNNLVSLGEILISIGLPLGAEQFGGIIQFSSLLSLIPIFLNTKKNKIFLLTIIVCPITFFLVSSPKPQLLFSITSLLIFIYLFKYFPKLNSKDSKISFFIIILILALNFLVKYSFLVSGILLGIYLLFLMFEKKLFSFSILSIIFIFILILLPHWIFRYNNFGTNIFQIISSPLPINIYGYEYYHSFLTSGSLPFLKIFVPLKLKEFSTTFGPTLFFLLLLINKKTVTYKPQFLIISSYILIVFIFGGNQTRFLYESFIWLVYLISITKINKSYFFNLFKKVSYAQCIFIIPIYIFFVIKLFPGSLNENYKTNVMKNYAYGYELASWANKNLDRDDILLSTHRSISLFKNKTYSSIFLWGVNFNEKESLIYSSFLKSKKINRIIFYDKKSNFKTFENCLGKLLFYEKNVGRYVGRNPLNVGERYDGWIYELKYEKFPNCLVE